MKKILLSIAITTAIASLTACHLEDHHGTGEDSHTENYDKNKGGDKNNNSNEHSTDGNSETADSLEIQTIKKPVAESSLNFSKFNWETIDKSNATDVTNIQLPEGMKLVDIPLESPDQVTSFTEAVTLNMYNDDKAYSEAGDLAYFDVAMIEEGEVFDKALFDTDSDKYMKSLGAVKVFDGVVPNEVVTELKAVEGTNSYEYMTGKTETSHLRQYALNHENGTQSFYQIVSDDTHGQIGILEITSARTMPTSNTEEADKAVADKAVADKAVADKEALAKAEADKEALAKSEADKGALAKAEADKEALAKAEADKEALAKAEADKKAVADKSEADKEALAKVEADKKAVADKASAKTSEDMKSQLDTGGKAILNIKFDPAKSTIKSKNQKIIDEIYTLLTDNPEMKVSIEGHTDDVGGADYNLKLSTERAEAVKNNLVKRGIDTSRLKTAGFGETKAMIPNTTMNNRAANRRVELVQFQ